MTMTKSDRFIDKFKPKLLNLAFTLFLQLSRLYGKIILKTSSHSFSLLNTTLKKRFLTKYGEKSVNYVNKLSLVISCKILHEKVPDEHLTFYNEEKETIDIEIDNIMNSDEIKKIIADYFLLMSFYFSISPIKGESSTSLSSTYLEKAGRYNEAVQPITTKIFQLMSKEIIKVKKKESQEYSKQLKTFLDEQLYSNIDRIEISPQQVTYLFSIITVIFVLTGFIYNKYYLGFFEIEVSRYFTISDYIATSIDKIYISGISAVIGIIFYLLGMFNHIIEQIKSTHFNIAKKHSFDMPVLLLILLFTIWTIISFYKDIYGKYTSLSFLIFFVLMYYYHKLPVHRFFKQEIWIRIFAVIMIYFSTNMFAIIMNDRDKIILTEHKDLTKYELIFDDSININYRSYILLSSNSGYFFLFDKKNHKSLVIPRTKLKYAATK